MKNCASVVLDTTKYPYALQSTAAASATASITCNNQPDGEGEKRTQKMLTTP